MQHVKRLWQADDLPLSNEKASTRSKLDQQAITFLEDDTVRVEHKGIQRYATPMLRANDAVQFHGDKDVVMSSLKWTERQLQRKPELAKIRNKQRSW